MLRIGLVPIVTDGSLSCNLIARYGWTGDNYGNANLKRAALTNTWLKHNKPHFPKLLFDRNGNRLFLITKKHYLKNCQKIDDFWKRNFSIAEAAGRMKVCARSMTLVCCPAGTESPACNMRVPWKQFLVIPVNLNAGGWRVSWTPLEFPRSHLIRSPKQFCIGNPFCNIWNRNVDLEAG